jgi:hypothetical protein
MPRSVRRVAMKSLWLKWSTNGQQTNHISDHSETQARGGETTAKPSQPIGPFQLFRAKSLIWLEHPRSDQKVGQTFGDLPVGQKLQDGQVQEWLCSS